MKPAILAALVALASVSTLVRRELHSALNPDRDRLSEAREADRREILKAYNASREAHYRHDAAAFLVHNDAEWRLVSDGAVVVRRKAVEQPRIQSYFDSVRFSSVTDLDPPQIEISSDGTMAWLIGHVRVRGVQRQTNGTEVPLAFDSAWIDLWQKKGAEWRIVARANTEKNKAGEH